MRFLGDLGDGRPTKHFRHHAQDQLDPVDLARQSLDRKHPLQHSAAPTEGEHDVDSDVGAVHQAEAPRSGQRRQMQIMAPAPRTPAVFDKTVAQNAHRLLVCANVHSGYVNDAALRRPRSRQEVGAVTFLLLKAGTVEKPGFERAQGRSSALGRCDQDRNPK